jgi:hypothetical protein
MEDSNHIADTPIEAAKTTIEKTLEQQIGDLEIECKYRLLKVNQSMRMKEISQLISLDLRGDLVKRASEIRGYKQLELAGESRMRELIGGHLLELRNMRDLGRFQQMRSHYQHREWSYMKAIFPTLFREADSEAERLERRLQQEADLERRSRSGSR